MTQHEPPTPKLLTMAQFANTMGLSTSKVKRLKTTGRIPYLQEGRTVRIPIEATDYQWLTSWQAHNGGHP